MTDLNPYEQRATMAPMPINKDHPIRFFTRNWQHKHLTQTQWEDVSPVIERMLTKCEWKPNNAVGPNETIPTCAEAVMALHCHIDMANRDFLNPNLPIREQKHLAALEWALRTLVTSEVLESRIKTIIGAALTCLIRPKVSLGQTDEDVGLAVIKFPKREAHRILKECMKAFRVLDEVSCWGINGFEDGEDDLGKNCRRKTPSHLLRHNGYAGSSVASQGRPTPQSRWTRKHGCVGGNDYYYSYNHLGAHLPQMDVTAAATAAHFNVITVYY